MRAVPGHVCTYGDAGIDRDAGALAEFVAQLLQGGRQAQIVEQRRAQVVRDAPDLGNGAGQTDQSFVDLGGRILAALDQTLVCQFEVILGRYQQLAQAVVQLARNAGTFFLLQADDALRQCFQFLVGQPVFADIERHAAGEYRQRSHDGDQRQSENGREHVRGHFFAQLVGAGGDIVEIYPGAEHPAPAVEHDHVADLVRFLPGRRFAPEIALEAAAGSGCLDQFLDHGQAIGVAHFPQVFADQFGLARVRQILPGQVVGKEIAVVAVIHFGQDAQGFGLGGSIVAPRTVCVVYRGQRQLDIVLQLGALGLEQAFLEQGLFFAAQVAHLYRDQNGNGEYRPDQGQYCQE